MTTHGGSPGRSVIANALMKKTIRELRRLVRVASVAKAAAPKKATEGAGEDGAPASEATLGPEAALLTVGIRGQTRCCA